MACCFAHRRSPPRPRSSRSCAVGVDGASRSHCTSHDDSVGCRPVGVPFKGGNVDLSTARRTLSVAIVTVVLALLPSAALGAVQPYGTNDGGGFRNILPPGENGLVNGSDAIQFGTAGTLPPHSNDQTSMYENLVYATPGLTAAQLPNYYKDATFGAQPTDVERTYSPR